MEIRERTINEEDFCTVLNENTLLKGELRCRQPILINCKFEGTIISESLVIIYQKGIFKGNIKARSIRVAGKIMGDLFASEMVDLENTAVIEGNIFSPTIQMEPGAMFEGQSHIVRKVDSDDERAAMVALFNEKSAKDLKQIESFDTENAKKLLEGQDSQAQRTDKSVKKGSQNSKTDKVNN